MTTVPAIRSNTQARHLGFSARKASAGTIGALKVVHITGIDTDKVFLVEPASGAVDKRKRGVTAEEITDTEDGLIISSGYMIDVDTSSWSENAELFADQSVPGNLTLSRPSNYLEPVASVVVSHSTDGVLSVYGVGLSYGSRVGFLIFKVDGGLVYDSNGHPQLKVSE